MKSNHEERYFNRGNQHLIVQPNGDDITLIDIILLKRNQRLHFYELYPPAVTTVFEHAIERAQENRNKIVIHIPKCVRDYERWLKKELDIKGKRCTIQIEGKPFIFPITDNKAIQLSMLDDNDPVATGMIVNNSMQISIKSIIMKNVINLPNFAYDYNVIYGSNVAWNDPETFKDRILHNCKKNYPKGILHSTFHDSDDEIWDYLMEIRGLELLVENNLADKNDEEDAEYEYQECDS